MLLLVLGLLHGTEGGSGGAAMPATESSSWGQALHWPCRLLSHVQSSALRLGPQRAHVCHRIQTPLPQGPCPQSCRPGLLKISRDITQGLPYGPGRPRAPCPWVRCTDDHALGVTCQVQGLWGMGNGQQRGSRLQGPPHEADVCSVLVLGLCSHCFLGWHSRTGAAPSNPQVNRGSALALHQGGADGCPTAGTALTPLASVFLCPAAPCWNAWNTPSRSVAH